MSYHTKKLRIKKMGEYFEPIKRHLLNTEHIYKSFLTYIDSEQNEEELFLNLKTLLQENHFLDDKHLMREFLHIISSISKHHHRSTSFFQKIEKIFHEFRKEISSLLVGEELLRIFRKSRRVLLLLFEQDFVQLNPTIARQIINSQKANFAKYFYPEIHPYFDSHQNMPIENIDIFKKLRRVGENESTICSLIRRDAIDDFIKFIHRKNVKPNQQIALSIFETNLDLLIFNVSLIEYAAYCGSFEILKYLWNQHIHVDPSKIFSFAIHGRNHEMIHFLEEKFRFPSNAGNSSYQLDAIRCHHNELAYYLFIKGFQSRNDDTFYASFVNYNYKTICGVLKSKSEFDLITTPETLFLDACENDYYYIVKILSNCPAIDVNAIDVLQFKMFHEISLD